MVKKKSMENCKECFVLADESKFNQISSVTFAPFEGATAVSYTHLDVYKRQAMKRAEERLANKTEAIDVKRAEFALRKALVRLDIAK